jgi:hypothetical protein
MKEYYVYCHKNPETLEIFYIGKGTKKRAYKKDGRGKYWINYVNKYGLPIIEFLYGNLNEDEAIKIEKELLEHLSDITKNEMVNNPVHYGGKDNVYEAIKVIDAWDLGFSLGNTVKYISRAGKKHKDKELEDLKKALWYLQHHIETLEKNK